jgi:putative transposase
MTMSTRYDAEKHHRRSIRLKSFDYKQAAAYFVTICTRNRDCLFGAISNNEQQLNDAGRLAQELWFGLPARFPGVAIDAFVVMPNHIHGVIVVGAQFIAPSPRHHDGAINRAPILGEIVRAYKAASARMIRQKVNIEFAWQRNY